MDEISDPALQFKRDIDFLINAPEFYEHLDMEERQACLRDRGYARRLVEFIFEYRVHKRTNELILAEDEKKPHNWQGEGF
jgi:hypothetical protein